MTYNVFVIGLDDFNLDELQTVHNAGDYTFHGLVAYDTMVNPTSYLMDAIMAEARETLRQAPSVDAIIGHWDFPTTSMLPVLRREWGLPTPSLESVLYCESKYWNRLAGQEALPECTPDFQGLDPYSDDPVRDLDMDYPFWLKPCKAFCRTLASGSRTRSSTARPWRPSATRSTCFRSPSTTWWVTARTLGRSRTVAAAPRAWPRR